MEIDIRENGNVTMPMVLVFLKVLMDSFIRVNGEMIFNMEKVLKNGPKE